jgi:hypothetical protein
MFLNIIDTGYEFNSSGNLELCHGSAVLPDAWLDNRPEQDQQTQMARSIPAPRCTRMGGPAVCSTVRCSVSGETVGTDCHLANYRDD